MNVMGIETSDFKFSPQVMPHKVMNNIAGASPVNVGQWERIGSALLGGYLVYRAIKNRNFGSLLFGGSGLGLLSRGVSGYCPAYGKMNLSSAEG